MIDRNAQILANRVEVLERRKGQLLALVDQRRAELSALSVGADRKAAEQEKLATLLRSLSSEGASRDLAKERLAVVLVRRGAFRGGLLFSIFFGLLVTLLLRAAGFR